MVVISCPEQCCPIWVKPQQGLTYHLCSHHRNSNCIHIDIPTGCTPWPSPPPLSPSLGPSLGENSITEEPSNSPQAKTPVAGATATKTHQDISPAAHRWALYMTFADFVLTKIYHVHVMLRVIPSQKAWPLHHVQLWCPPIGHHMKVKFNFGLLTSCIVMLRCLQGTSTNWWNCGHLVKQS